VTKKLLHLYFLLFLSFCFGQQNKEFKEVKNFYDYQRYMLNNEFKKRFDKEVSPEQKMTVKNDFKEFMLKLDSIQNAALLNALVRVKIREDLKGIQLKNTNTKQTPSPKKSDLSSDAQYPGGFELMRKQLVDSFYSDAILANEKVLKTSLVFVVEKDGSISSVKADGDNFTFNRQAEIALYLLPEKFSPAYVKGTAVRYRFRLPLAMNFD